VNSQLPPHRPAGQSFSSAPETSETKKNKTTITTKELVSILVAYFRILLFGNNFSGSSTSLLV
jgi:hypothetical protein